ncbi:hypothetical protein FVE85_2409 [Porphyridium purpureum]|uniref:Uncharacterized protein n=1 Tax=Porphyridium purpureum TaxID=35688 RepID=A0A5J4YZV1_PORPP|nr:hypothetical protein FVE85_2409 [Porphyridium purpureum]|eukprot:POR7426..scf209_3
MARLVFALVCLALLASQAAHGAPVLTPFSGHLQCAPGNDFSRQAPLAGCEGEYVSFSGCAPFSGGPNRDFYSGKVRALRTSTGSTIEFDSVCRAGVHQDLSLDVRECQSTIDVDLNSFLPQDTLRARGGAIFSFRQSIASGAAASAGNLCDKLPLDSNHAFHTMQGVMDATDTQLEFVVLKKLPFAEKLVSLIGSENALVSFGASSESAFADEPICLAAAACDGFAKSLGVQINPTGKLAKALCVPIPFVIPTRVCFRGLFHSVSGALGRTSAVPLWDGFKTHQVSTRDAKFWASARLELYLPTDMQPTYPSVSFTFGGDLSLLVGPREVMLDLDKVDLKFEIRFSADDNDKTSFNIPGSMASAVVRFESENEDCAPLGLFLALRSGMPENVQGGKSRLNEILRSLSGEQTGELALVVRDSAIESFSARQRFTGSIFGLRLDAVLQLHFMSAGAWDRLSAIQQCCRDSDACGMLAFDGSRLIDAGFSRDDAFFLTSLRVQATFNSGKTVRVECDSIEFILAASAGGHLLVIFRGGATVSTLSAKIEGFVEIGLIVRPGGDFDADFSGKLDITLTGADKSRASVRMSVTGNVFNSPLDWDWEVDWTLFKRIEELLGDVIEGGAEVVDKVVGGAEEALEGAGKFLNNAEKEVNKGLDKLQHHANKIPVLRNTAKFAESAWEDAGKALNKAAKEIEEKGAELEALMKDVCQELAGGGILANEVCDRIVPDFDAIARGLFVWFQGANAVKEYLNKLGEHYRNIWKDIGYDLCERAAREHSCPGRTEHTAFGCRVEIERKNWKICAAGFCREVCGCRDTKRTLDEECEKRQYERVQSAERREEEVRKLQAEKTAAAMKLQEQKEKMEKADAALREAESTEKILGNDLARLEKEREIAMKKSEARKQELESARRNTESERTASMLTPAQLDSIQCTRVTSSRSRTSIYVRVSCDVLCPVGNRLQYDSFAFPYAIDPFARQDDSERLDELADAVLMNRFASHFFSRSESCLTLASSCQSGLSQERIQLRECSMRADENRDSLDRVVDTISVLNLSVRSMMSELNSALISPANAVLLDSFENHLNESARDGPEDQQQGLRASTGAKHVQNVKGMHLRPEMKLASAVSGGDDAFAFASELMDVVTDLLFSAKGGLGLLESMRDDSVFVNDLLGMSENVPASMSREQFLKRGLRQMEQIITSALRVTQRNNLDEVLQRIELISEETQKQNPSSFIRSLQMSTEAAEASAELWQIVGIVFGSLAGALLLVGAALVVIPSVRRRWQSREDFSSRSSTPRHSVGVLSDHDVENFIERDVHARTFNAESENNLPEGFVRVTQLRRVKSYEETYRTKQRRFSATKEPYASTILVLGSREQPSSLPPRARARNAALLRTRTEREGSA